MQQLAGSFGVIAVLQLLFFPGCLLLKLLRLEVPLIRLLTLSFGLSLLCNYLLVGILTLLHCYKPEVVWSVILVELLCLVWLFYRDRLPWNSIRLQLEMGQGFFKNDQSTLTHCLWYFAIAVILLCAAEFFTQWGQIFTQWDPVMSYNVWAEQWANNQLPIYTWHYPQLIPTNWSLTYVMLDPVTHGVHLQFFSKSVMTLFLPVMLLAMLDLALTTKQPAYLLAVLLSAWQFYNLFSNYAGQGWTDVPMATLSFLSIYAILLAREAIGHRPKQVAVYLLISALLAGAAASTKQAGLYLVAWYPFLLISLVLNKQHLPLGKKLIKALLPWVLALVICLPWYLYIQWQITHGRAVSEIGFVTQQIYYPEMHTNSVIFRVLFGFLESGLIFWLLLIITAISLRHLSTWKVLAWMGLAYTAIWLAFYTYDIRNIAMAVPLMSVAAAMAIIECQGQRIQKLISLFKRLNPSPLLTCGIILFAVLLMGKAPFYHADALAKQQHTLELKLGDEDLNWELLRYKQLHGFQGKIVTSWDFIAHVPGLSEYYQPYRPPGVEANPYQSAWMTNPAELASVLKLYPAKYILSDNEDVTSAAYVAYFQLLAIEGKIKPLFELPKFSFYEIMVSPDQL